MTSSDNCVKLASLVAPIISVHLGQGVSKMNYNDSTVISNNILNRAFNEGVSISPMKLQKIMYYVASEFAKATGRPLFSEKFEAWQYGPVLPSIYREFRPFSGRPITNYATQDALGNAYLIDESTDVHLKEALDRVWNRTRNLGAVELSRLTHAEDSAWYKAWQRGPNSSLNNDDILNDGTYQQKLDLGFYADNSAGA